jgi:hypothetical protein
MWYVESAKSAKKLRMVLPCDLGFLTPEYKHSPMSLQTKILETKTMRRNYKYQLYRQEKVGFFSEYPFQKIIGIAIILIVVTIIVTVLAFEVVFVWTFPVQKTPAYGSQGTAGQ